MSITVQINTDVQPATQWTKCRSCYSPVLTEVVNLGEQYVSTYLNSNQTPHPNLKVPIILDQCTHCGLTQQRYTAPSDFLYTRHYWYRSGTTSTMRDSLRELTESAIAKLGKLTGRTRPLSVGDIVLDIGSNDGTLLRSYTTSGVIKIGVEPAVNMLGEGSTGIDVFINDFWSAKGYYESIHKYIQDTQSNTFNKNPNTVNSDKAKIVTAIGMFYDLDFPNEFIRDIKQVLHKDGIFVAQLMCAKQMLAQGDVGNLAHEHLEFYTLKSLHQLYMRNGLQIIDIEENEVNGGSYRIYARHTFTSPQGDRIPNKEEAEGIKRFSDYLSSEKSLNTVGPFDQFVSRIEENRVNCCTFIYKEAKKGKRVFVYGASTKGNVILQYYDLDKTLIQFAAEKSSDKFGKYTVGTNIPIISEFSARLMKPDYFLVLPYAFINEFVDKEKDQTWRKNGGKFIVPLPKFEVL